LGGGLGTTYDVHLGLIGKRIVDFLLVIIELISLDVTAEALRAIIGSKSAISLQRGSVDRKFQVEWVAPTIYSPFSQQTRINALSFGMKICTDFSFVLSQSTRLTDGQTDRILIARPRLHSMHNALAQLVHNTKLKNCRETARCSVSFRKKVTCQVITIRRFH